MCIRDRFREDAGEEESQAEEADAGGLVAEFIVAAHGTYVYVYKRQLQGKKRVDIPIGRPDSLTGRSTGGLFPRWPGRKRFSL